MSLLDVANKPARDKHASLFSARTISPEVHVLNELNLFQVMLLKLNKEGPFKKDVFRAPGHQVSCQGCVTVKSIGAVGGNLSLPPT